MNWDPDIANLAVSSEEKNGLQVFRNYSSAFERHRIKTFIEEVNKVEHTVEDLERVQELILAEDPRFLAVIVSAYVDEQLDEMFKREVPDEVPGRSNLFSGFGPLSRYAQRIQMAYAFRWVSPDILGEADQLRKLRNDVSHKWAIGDLKERLATLISKSMSPIETFLDDRARLPKDFHKSLNDIELFRVRLLWLVGRFHYECAIAPQALKKLLNPAAALYGAEPPKLLVKVAGLCVANTRVVLQPNSNRTRPPAAAGE